MRIFQDDFQKKSLSNEKRVLALGNFDGLHLGHRKVIEQMVFLAKENDARSGVLTFNPLPQQFFKKTSFQKLMSFEDWQSELQGLGVQDLFVQEFNQQFSDLLFEEFMNHYLYSQFRPKGLVVGEDYRFGKKATGNVADLKAYSDTAGWQVISVKHLQDSFGKVSSTRIREALMLGQVQQAEGLLGKSYRLSGKIIDGEKRGRTLGFPTANILVKGRLIPGNGVYIVSVELKDSKYWGVVNIGLKPTFCNPKAVNIECHILDFDKDIYGEILTLDFKSFIRKETKFSGIEPLKQQIQKDIVFARTFIGSSL